MLLQSRVSAREDVIGRFSFRGRERDESVWNECSELASSAPFRIHSSRRLPAGWNNSKGSVRSAKSLRNPDYAEYSRSATPAFELGCVGRNLDWSRREGRRFGHRADQMEPLATLPAPARWSRSWGQLPRSHRCLPDGVWTQVVRCGP